MDQDLVLRTVGELYLKVTALARQVQELVAERDDLRHLVEQLKDGSQ